MCSTSGLTLLCTEERPRESSIVTTSAKGFKAKGVEILKNFQWNLPHAQNQKVGTGLREYLEDVVITPHLKSEETEASFSHDIEVDMLPHKI